MKTSLAKAIALAATLGAAASSHAALSLNPNGQGEVLLYPLYTVENGNDTAISVTNTTNEYKVVKVRFREALNSQDVLDFHLFLSPEDVWNGVVVATETGAKLITRDTSCTVPAIPADGQPFTNLAYAGGAVETAIRGQDGGPQDLKRTRVGYVEIIELGVLDPTVATSTLKTAPATFWSFGEAVKHVNGVPGNCAALVAEYTTGQWKDTAPNDFNYGFKNVAAGPVLGGLYGVGTITNVFAGQQIGYDATAIDDFIDTTGANANLHNATGYSFPDLNGNRAPGQAVTVPAEGVGATKSAVINGTTYNFAKTIDAVSAVLQRTQLNNEFSVDSVVGGGTDWVVTFPTKHHYVWDSQIAADGKRATFTAAGAIGAPTTGTPVVDVPANSAYATLVTDYPLAKAGQANVSPFKLEALWKGTAGAASANVEIGLSYLDREEKKVVPVPGGISFSPRPAAVPAGKDYLRFEANVITFNNSNVLVAEDSYARNNFNLEAAYKSGWASIDLTKGGADSVVTDTAARKIAGLPAIGFATIKVTNGDLGGVLSNYNSAWNHKSN